MKKLFIRVLDDYILVQHRKNYIVMDEKISTKMFKTRSKYNAIKYMQSLFYNRIEERNWSMIEAKAVPAYAFNLKEKVLRYKQMLLELNISCRIIVETDLFGNPDFIFVG